jgi:squalene-associated FAD-dependent desaturase
MRVRSAPRNAEFEGTVATVPGFRGIDWKTFRLSPHYAARRGKRSVCPRITRREEENVPSVPGLGFRTPGGGFGILLLNMPSVLIAGGGLAGLAAAAALGRDGWQVDLFEARPFLGGRATSYPVPGGGEEVAETIDNCQHILLRCCVNLLDFYQRLGVRERIRFHREFFFIEPGGRISVLKRGRLPAPLHFTGAFMGLKCLDLADKIAIGRALLAIRRERTRRTDLDRISMLDWLLQKRQTPRAIDRFWRQILVSAINEDLDRMAAVHGFQVFWLGFLKSADGYEMGIPSIPLGELYSPEVWRCLPNVRLHLRSQVEKIDGAGFVLEGKQITADQYISALPFERMESVGLPAPKLQHSPITGIHLWFDREVTTLPHATLLDRTIQWVFNKQGGKYLQLVVSASRDLTALSRSEIIDMAVGDLRLFFPRVLDAKLLKAHVVKEQRATFSAAPDTEALRPQAATAEPNLHLAGDWTSSGWPATMEGAVRSGYRAAESASRAAGKPALYSIS